MLGEWWIANPTEGSGTYEPPIRSRRIPGVLRDRGNHEFTLETIGFLSESPIETSNADSRLEDSSPEIWGMDREAKCYSLFDNLRVYHNWKPDHVSDGHEDWKVGWFAKGNAWVASDEECKSALILLDDLGPWAVYPRPGRIEFNEAMNAATIDLRRETLGSKSIDGVRVSLIRGSSFKSGAAGQESEGMFLYKDEVYWRLEGPLNLRLIVTDWIGQFERFNRFMTMRPSVVRDIDCELGKAAGRRLKVELIVRRLPRLNEESGRGGIKPSPHRFLTTLRLLEELGIDPLAVFNCFWRQVANGGADMAMSLHLESQDGLLSRAADSALLNAIRSIESLYTTFPDIPKSASVQAKIDDAVERAGDVGGQVLAAWPGIRTLGKLRREIAHGKSRPSASFGIRCRAGAIALQWIQRCQLLRELGIDETATQSIVSKNHQYPLDLENLRLWDSEL